ncbi:hypothetical protein JW930_06510 [Candidatus Woesearchaeota archaeon]|nr:hypothetical protein [Candidatus Woesearchaeota archaeon]
MDKIRFSKPNLNKITKDYFCVDLHLHTEASDGASSVREVLKKCSEKGICVAITDHNEIEGVLENKRIIPGIEVKFKGDLDVLFYFYSVNELKKFYVRQVKKYLSKSPFYPRISANVLELLDTSKKYNCISSFAHPYKYRERKDFYDILKKVDAVEVINSGMGRKANLFALEKAKEFRKSITGGSDAHSIYELGGVITYSKAGSVKEFLDNIKKKKNYVVGKELRFLKAERYWHYFRNRVRRLFL